MADLDDSQKGTTAEGIHLGAMAGSVDIMQRGYTGIETRGGALRFNPALPREIEEFSMRLRFRRHLLKLERLLKKWRRKIKSLLILMR